MYHGVGRVGVDPFALFVPPDRFAEQMRTLRRVGLRGVSLGELGDAAARGDADGLVGLTFDDGYRDVRTWAAPVLEQCGFTATVFVVSGLLDGENVWDPPPRRQLVDAADLRDLAARGWEIGSHSVTHARLTEVDPGRLQHEVAASRAALSELMGVEARSFCYPYGAVDGAAVDAVRAAGYTYACAVTRVAGLPTILATPRIGVTGRDRGLRLAAKLVLRGR
ncbi:polysaccharide deacetylase family protein [Friedmanniella luteola]|nr:polysaccharide deacetylase family protein [Friedmanniella luteola]